MIDLTVLLQMKWWFLYDEHIRELSKMSSLSFFLAFVLHAGEWNIELEIFYAGFVFSLLYSVCNIDGLGQQSHQLGY